LRNKKISRGCTNIPTSYITINIYFFSVSKDKCKQYVEIQLNYEIVKVGSTSQKNWSENQQQALDTYMYVLFNPVINKENQ